MSFVVKLSEDPAENARMLEKLMKERRYLELNGLNVEPRFAEKPPCDVTFESKIVP